MQNGNTKTQGFDIHVILRQTHSFLGLKKINPTGQKWLENNNNKATQWTCEVKEKHGA